MHPAVTDRQNLRRSALPPQTACRPTLGQMARRHAFTSIDQRFSFNTLNRVPGGVGASSSVESSQLCTVSYLGCWPRCGQADGWDDCWDERDPTLGRMLRADLAAEAAAAQLFGGMAACSGQRPDLRFYQAYSPCQATLAHALLIELTETIASHLKKHRLERTCVVSSNTLTQEVPQ